MVLRRSTHSIHYGRDTPLLPQMPVSVQTPEQMRRYMANLRLRGYLILIGTWVMFAWGIGSIFGLWDWCFRLRSKALQHINIPMLSPIISYLEDAFSQETVIKDYYAYAILLNFTIMWIWCVISWLGMKLFRHSKGGGS